MAAVEYELHSRAHIRGLPDENLVPQVLNSAAAGETLQMNAGYFFRLLEHMTAGGFECMLSSFAFACILVVAWRSAAGCS